MFAFIVAHDGVRDVGEDASFNVRVWSFLRRILASSATTQVCALFDELTRRKAGNSSMPEEAGEERLWEGVSLLAPPKIDSFYFSAPS